MFLVQEQMIFVVATSKLVAELVNKFVIGTGEEIQHILKTFDCQTKPLPDIILHQTEAKEMIVTRVRQHPFLVTYITRPFHEIEFARSNQVSRMIVASLCNVRELFRQKIKAVASSECLHSLLTRCPLYATLVTTNSDRIQSWVLLNDTTRQTESFTPYRHKYQSYIEMIARPNKKQSKPPMQKFVYFGFLKLA